MISTPSPTEASRLARFAFPTLVAAGLLASLPAAAQTCEVRIGSAGPLTGGGSPWGLAEKAGTEFEAAWVNANGGLQMGNRKCKVEVFSVDAMATAAGGAAASNYLASKNVHAVIGPIASPETTGFKPVAKRNGQINFSSSISADVISPEYPLAFVKSLAPAVWAPTIIKKAKERFKFSSAVILGPNDQAGTDAAKAFSTLYTQAGVTPTVEYYQRGTINFAPLVVRLMSTNPGVVELAGFAPGDAAILVKQMLEAGYTGAFDRSGAGAETILKASGGIEAQKAFFWQDAVPTEDPGILKLNADFERLMKTPAPENSLFHSAQIATEQILKAISRAGTDQDGEKIAAALREITPESRYLGKGGWRGKAQYGINQQLAFPVGMGLIDNGKKQPQIRIEVPAE